MQAIKITADPQWHELFLKCAKRFDADWPDRRGFNNGAIYSAETVSGQAVSVYVYRTDKGMIVARQNGEVNDDAKQ